MADLIPTTDEAAKDKDIADAAAGKRSIVHHLGPDYFEKDGLLPFFDYRPLGLKELTDGKVGSQVIRAKPGQHADAPRHTHTLEFQLWRAQAGRRLDRLSAAGNSEDFEVLEITMPTDFETTEVK